MEKFHSHSPLGIVLLCFLSTSLAISPTNFSTDQSSLLALKAHISVDTLQILAKNWSIGSSVCDWIGVSCGSRHHRVAALNISNMGLNGAIPPQLGNLSFLVSLDMSMNNFHGELPHEFAGLSRLKLLNLGVNNLEGEFPHWIGSFPQLRRLSLSNNKFTGLIPSSISNMSKLKEISLSYNLLQGNILTGIFNISSLQVINLTGNGLSGTIPSDLCHHLRALSLLSLSLNKLNGQLPSSLGQCSELQGLSLSYNQFTGSIPKEIGDLKKLEVLYLGANYLEDSDPEVGKIPKGIGDMKKLDSLDLVENNLEGEIPKEIGNLTMLKELHLGHCNLTGEIPKEIGDLNKLEDLDLGDNYLEGEIPKEIGNLTMMKELDLRHANLRGVIPREIGNLYFLERLNLEQNSLTGSIPMGIFNLSRLIAVVFVGNQLSGNLPSTFGYRLPNLERIYLGINSFSGVLPTSISNSSKLRRVDFSSNKFTGPIPTSFGDLSLLELLDLADNNLTSDSSSQELDIITSLTNCKNLSYLELSGNPLNAIIPESVSNLSTSLERLLASDCKIKGSIPDGIGNFSSLIQLDLSNNELIGLFPARMKDLQRLQYMDLSRNKLSKVPLQLLCVFYNLATINLAQNQIINSIPKCLGNLISLRNLNLSYNKLNSMLPVELWNLKYLLVLDLSSNLLSGSLPQAITNMKMAVWVDLSTNQLSGGIPGTIGEMQNLKNLSLAHNRLQGSIPESIGKMLSLESLDLSHNFLFGSVPMSMENLRYLRHFNVSFNNLSGEVPSRGPFINFTAESFTSNQALCGAQRFHVPPCLNKSAHKLRTKKLHRTIFILLGVIIAAGVLSFGFVYLRYRKKDTLSNGANLSLVAMPERISYFKLLQATNGYSESNLLGTGSFGSVYRGTLDDGRLVAAKVFNLQVEGALRSFDVECEVLRNLRHRNLTGVITSCSNPEFKALVLEFMPNGSLEKWLYSHNYFLDMMQRLDILIDVACALQYLHCEYSIPVIHCDLKPSNVLLDQDMVAHLSDFSLTKLLGEENSITYTKTLATLGYLAPEYGLEGLVSTKCDTYSFGIIMLEVFTRTKPNSEMFGENLSLKSWVIDSLPDGLAHVIDANLLKKSDEYFVEKLSCIASIMKVALDCTMESPRERSNIKDVLVVLKKIKLQYISALHSRTS
ncbi:probable LRR receptor-like serine/threonine-protein kinase At3g47570 [Coffea eugenioides]|uniref:probable LRR receptor-like serine/threonine-protein kinase At3g47570 n=1 Tax=Coffea eugenioides TaxID=49369 RepID=UPI000F604B37|nr:probable LRR receptor-like serine/threonine-protein kinase At3g47570 [Coffea eugenioides]